MAGGNGSQRRFVFRVDGAKDFQTAMKNSDSAIKARIKELIDAEDALHPLSDDEITKMLNGEGVTISRRTVAKYRGAMKIPGKIERAAYH